MRAVIDATPLLIRSAGVKNYLYYWISYLRRTAGADAIGTFPALDPLGPLHHDASVASRWQTLSGLGTLALSNYTGLPLLARAVRGADVFHTSALVRHPPRGPRLTATIHDLTCWLMPELHSAANIRADRSFAEILRRADRLIAVSEGTRNDAIRVLDLDPQKIEVVYSGVAPEFFQPPPREIHKRYKLAKPFVLFVGTIEPRKNLGTLLDAFQALPQDIREEFDLVIVGPTGWADAGTRSRLASARYLGYVPEEDMAPLTAAAAVFAYPSLYEGFGFPVAQAMAAGAPVVTSNVSSLPEIAGGAALLVDPRSAAELRDVLARLLTSPDLRAELAGKGRARAAAFRWETCAAQSLDFLHGVAGN